MAKCIVAFCLFIAGVLGGVSRPLIDSKVNWRVVGGSNAADGEYRYQVSLLYRGSHNCGGSIVSNEYVITAAHCVVDYSLSSLTVLVGTNQLSSGGTTYAVLEIHYHENYDSWVYHNDVAIMKVEPITYTDRVEPIVAETEYIGGNEDVVLSGWGRTSYPGPIPDDLQYINLKTLTFEDCKSKHDFPPVVDTEICTYIKLGEGACKGDSGGPLVRSVDGAKKLVGIVSWGQPCAKGYPDVFARVSSYVNWFNEKCNNCLG